MRRSTPLSVEQLEDRSMPSAVITPPLLSLSADGSAIDEVSGKPSTIASSVQYVEGVRGQAFAILQPNAGVTLPQDAAIDFERDQPFSITAWARVTGQGSALTLFEKGEFREGRASYGMALRPGGESLIVDAWLEGSSNSNRIYWRGVGPAKDQAWHHYAMTYDGSSHISGVHVLIDGVEINRTYGEDELDSSIKSGAPATIGTGFEGSPEEFASGEVDIAQVFGKVLTVEEIAASIEADRQPVQPSTPPAAPDEDKSREANLVTSDITALDTAFAPNEYADTLPPPPGHLLFRFDAQGEGFHRLKTNAGITLPQDVTDVTAAIDRSQPFSIAAWAKLDQLEGGSALTLFEKGRFAENGSSYGMALRRNSEGRVLIDVWLQSGSNRNRVYWRGMTPVGDTDWHHYAMAYNGNSWDNGVTVYVDGVALPGAIYTETTLLTGSIRSDAPVTIGEGFEGSPDDVIEAIIGDVRLYGASLNAEEVTRAMAADLYDLPEVALLRTVETPQGILELGDPQEALRQPVLNNPDLIRVAHTNVMTMAGLGIKESAEQISRRLAPWLFEPDASPSARAEQIWSVFKEFGHAEDIIRGAAAAAFNELLCEKMGQAVESPGAWEGILRSHPRMSVIGPLGILPSAGEIRSAVAAHFDEIYAMLQRVAGDDAKEQQRAARMQRRARHTAPAVSPEIHRRIMETILKSEGEKGTTPAERIANYVRANRDAMAYIPEGVRVAVEELLKDTRVASAGISTDNFQWMGEETQSARNETSLGMITERTGSEVMSLTPNGTAKITFSVAQESMVNFWANAATDRDLSVNISGGTLPPGGYTSEKKHPVYSTAQSVSLKLLPGVTYTLTVRDVTNYGEILNGEELRKQDVTVPVQMQIEKYATQKINGKISIEESGVAMPVSLSVVEFQENGKRKESVETNGLDPTKPVWVLIHGRNDYPDSGKMLELAKALTESGYQVVTLDWQAAAGSNTPGFAGLQGEYWIEKVADWAYRALKGAGIEGKVVRIGTHSWGSFEGYEIAKRFKAENGFGVDTLVALDSAKDPTLTTGYDASQVNFQDVSKTSIAFHSSFWGSQGRSHTAQYSIEIRSPRSSLDPREMWDITQEHGLAVTTFANLVHLQKIDPTNDLAKLFALDSSQNSQLPQQEGFDAWLWVESNLRTGDDSTDKYIDAMPSMLSKTDPDDGTSDYYIFNHLRNLEQQLTAP